METKSVLLPLPTKPRSRKEIYEIELRRRQQVFQHDLEQLDQQKEELKNVHELLPTARETFKTLAESFEEAKTELKKLEGLASGLPAHIHVGEEFLQRDKSSVANWPKEFEEKFGGL